MGRTQPSIVQPPASFRRSARAKEAKLTVNNTIPRLLSAHRRAQLGIEATELLVEPLEPYKSTSIRPEEGQHGPRLSLLVADTLTAAHSLLFNSSNASHEPNKKTCKVAILNMASPLSPGGGVLNGANSQEESLCRRTTLLPALRDEFYRLPELGAVYTPDVLVFKDESDDRVLEKKDRWFVDCVTAAMLRMPDCQQDESGTRVYENQKDRDLALAKMNMVLRISQLKGVQRLVLGAWGCGAYGNPVGEIAKAWRKALLPNESKRNGESSIGGKWNGIEEVVFAIKDRVMAEQFAAAFGRDILNFPNELHEDTSDNESSSEKDDQSNS